MHSAHLACSIFILAFSINGCASGDSTATGGDGGDEISEAGAEGGDETTPDSATDDTGSETGDSSSTDSTVMDSGGGDTGIGDTGAETPFDSSPGDTGSADTGSSDTGTLDDSSVTDTGTLDDSLTDTGASDTGAGDTGIIDDSGLADTGIIDDSSLADTGATDTGGDSAASDSAADTTMDTAMCVIGTLCPDHSVCVSGTCTPCAVDSNCTAVAAGTRCYAGKCESGTCHPKSDPTNCTTAGSICCSTATSMGTCFAPAGGARCCDTSDCPTGTTCTTSTHTCTCGPPVAGEFNVSPSGSDATGNGSASCPFKTITKAITMSGGAAAMVTIKVHAGIYGKGCSGGAPCDAAITVPATVTNGLVFAGDGVGAVTVTSDAAQVFLISAPAVGIRGMTIVPTKTAINNGGGHGIVVDAAPATTEKSFTDLVITGIPATSTTAGSGSGVFYKNAGSPTVGPNVTITGGFDGVRVEGTALPAINGTVAGPVAISGSGGPCVFVFSTAVGSAPGVNINAATVASQTVTLTDCGGAGIHINVGTSSVTSTIDHTIASKSSGGNFSGLQLVGAASAIVTNSKFVGVGRDGMAASGTSQLIATSVDVSNNLNGVNLVGTTIGTFDTVIANGESFDGMYCTDNSSMKVRNSTTLSNGHNGAFFDGNCVPDIGTSADLGHNVFNRTSKKNVLSGLCLLTTAVSVGFTYAGHTYSCSRVATGCAAGSPGASDVVGGISCQGNKDITNGGGLSVYSNTMCCN